MDFETHGAMHMGGEWANGEMMSGGMSGMGGQHRAPTMRPAAAPVGEPRQLRRSGLPDQDDAPQAVAGVTLQKAGHPPYAGPIRWNHERDRPLLAGVEIEVDLGVSHFSTGPGGTAGPRRGLSGDDRPFHAEHLHTGKKRGLKRRGGRLTTHEELERPIRFVCDRQANRVPNRDPERVGNDAVVRESDLDLRYAGRLRLGRLLRRRARTSAAVPAGGGRVREHEDREERASHWRQYHGNGLLCGTSNGSRPRRATPGPPESAAQGEWHRTGSQRPGSTAAQVH